MVSQGGLASAYSTATTALLTLFDENRHGKRVATFRWLNLTRSDFVLDFVEDVCMPLVKWCWKAVER